VFHITAGIGCIKWLPVSGYHSDRCGLQSVRYVKGSHIGYKATTYHASAPAGRWPNSYNWKLLPARKVKFVHSTPSGNNGVNSKEIHTTITRQMKRGSYFTVCTTKFKK